MKFFFSIHLDTSKIIILRYDYFVEIFNQNVITLNIYVIIYNIKIIIY